jgi:serine/threonine-protein kinase
VIRTVSGAGARMTEPPALRVGESLGVGALAETFLAHDADGVTRVLKRMHRHCAYDPALVAMFEHEGRLLGRLDHPAIPALRALYRDAAGLPHLVIDRVEGRGLDAVLAGPPVAQPTAVAWIAALLDALDHVHTRADEEGVGLGAVHRDVAPGNVIVRDDGGVSLVDFGIATSRWREDPERGVLKGTRGYMAPEVVTGEGIIDGRSDVFAAAVLLYELLTGRRLYGGGAMEAMLAIAEGPVPSAREVEASVPAWLDELLERCLAKSPEARPTAREARATLLAG